MALLTTHAAWGGQRVRVGVYQNSPKVGISESGKPEGIFIDIIEAIAAKEGWTLEYAPGTWTQGLERLAAGQIDLMTDVSHTQAREQVYNFHHEPVLSDWFQIYARRGSGIRSLLDLAGKRITVLDQSVQQEAFAKITTGFDLDVKILPFPDYSKAFSTVANGGADAVITNRFYGLWHLGGSNLEDTAIIFNPTRLFFAAPKTGNPALLEAIDKHLAQFKNDADSIYYTSLRRWTSEQIRPKLPSWFKGVAFSALALLALCVAFVVLLRRQVAARTRELARRNEELRAAHDKMVATEKALRESELKHRALYETANDAIILMSQDHVIECNARTLAMFGCERGQIIGKPLYEFSPTNQPDGRNSKAKALEKIRLAMAGEAQFFEWEHLRKAGTPFGAEISLNRLELGGEILLQAILRDTSARRKAEDEAKLSTAIVQYLSKYANDFIILLDADFHFLEINQRMIDFYGYTREELMGMHASLIRAPETKNEFNGQIEAAQVTGVAIYETMHKRKDGTTFPVEISLRAIENDGKRFYQAIIRDITERKQAENALRKSEATIRSVFRAAPVGICIVKDRIYQSANKFWCEKFGYQEKDIIGKTTRMIYESDCEYNRVEHELYSHLQQRGMASAETRHRSSSGAVIDVFLTVAPIQQNDLSAGNVVIVNDITERKRAEAKIREFSAGLERRVAERTLELAEARNRAEAADRLKSAFLATMSHELRTPLNSIIGFTGIILQELAGPLNPEQRKQLDMVRGSSRHLLALINDVLDISKIEAGQMVVREEKFDPRALIAKALATVKPMAEKKGLAMNSEITPDVGSLVNDPRRVEQVLLNLLNNSIKFTERGSVTLTAGIERGSPSDPHPSLRISIADTGIGIKPEDLGSLFQPFRQIDSGLSRQHEGTGLGLAICHRLAELMGGTMRAESEWGKGSVFTLVLPSEPR